MEELLKTQETGLQCCTPQKLRQGLAFHGDQVSTCYIAGIMVTTEDCRYQDAAGRP